ncbi:hypothetical protein M758_5G074400 [Ceratodon purpureus]|nr:hypothetical protein M758_5G074400 [Ceratodon purpureus]
MHPCSPPPPKTHTTQLNHPSIPSLTPEILPAPSKLPPCPLKRPPSTHQNSHLCTAQLPKTPPPDPLQLHLHLHLLHHYQSLTPNELIDHKNQTHDCYSQALSLRGRPMLAESQRECRCCNSCGGVMIGFRERNK